MKLLDISYDFFGGETAHHKKSTYTGRHKLTGNAGVKSIPQAGFEPTVTVVE
jgi:hypothetical protein